MNKEKKDSVCLIAEDDTADFFLLQRALLLEGFAGVIQHARDGVEAIEYLSGEKQFSNREKYPLPDFIVLDLKMPRADGFDVLSWLHERSNGAGVPVVVFSSSDDRGDMERAHSLGATSYLLKPSGPSTYLDSAKALKELWAEGFGDGQGKETCGILARSKLK